MKRGGMMLRKAASTKMTTMLVSQRARPRPVQQAMPMSSRGTERGHHTKLKDMTQTIARRRRGVLQILRQMIQR